AFLEDGNADSVSHAIPCAHVRACPNLMRLTCACEIPHLAAICICVAPIESNARTSAICASVNFAALACSPLATGLPQVPCLTASRIFSLRVPQRKCSGLTHPWCPLPHEWQTSCSGDGFRPSTDEAT